MHASPSIRIATATSAVVLATGLAAVPAQARTEVLHEEVPYGLLYDNVVVGTGDPDLILLAGGTAEDFCTGNVPPARLLVRLKDDPPAAGASQDEKLVDRGPLTLYDGGGLDAMAFLDQACGTYFSGGDVPEPKATGYGRITAGIHVDWPDEGPEDARQTNSAQGPVRTPDGRVLVVRGEAELTLAPTFSVDAVSVEVLND